MASKKEHKYQMNTLQSLHYVNQIIPLQQQLKETPSIQPKK